MRIFLTIVLIVLSTLVSGQSRALVFQSDFGLKDGAVAAMKGVAYSVSGDLQLFDITHEIPPFNIWEAAYRLKQSAPYWPPGTVFVSVVDPGVGSDRKSVVMQTKTGHYFVTPDNGTLTFVAEAMGIAAVREIDEAKNRLRNSDQSYTFHGRDVYAYTGARLASGIISFDEVGPLIQSEIVKLPYKKASFENGSIRGIIDILDVQYGNVWTNIDSGIFENLKVNPGDSVKVIIYHGKAIVYQGDIRFARTFAEVPAGRAVAYINSLMNLSLGINHGNFAQQYKIGSGSDWTITVSAR